MKRKNPPPGWDKAKTRAVAEIELLALLALRRIRRLGQYGAPGSDIRRAARAFYRDVNMQRKSSRDLLQGREWMRRWRGPVRGGRSKPPSAAEAIVHNCVRDLETRRVPRDAWPEFIRKKLAAARRPRSARTVSRILKKIGK